MGLDLLELQVRTKKTKANRLRQEGYVPGVIYGKGVSRPIILNRKNLENSVRLLGENAVFNISLEGRSELVRIRELQRDPLTREIIHIDLQSTQEGEKIKAFVPIHFEGKHVLEKKGYIINRQMNKIGIEGLAGTIPAYINVPLSAYDLGQSIKVQDLELAEELSILEAPESIIASINKPGREAEKLDDKADINENTEKEEEGAQV
ncbi:MAG: 50S ribosomal protein L25 [Clostridia bacterium]|nr:50S ribosomal protein L25 [Clostridia bacterium]